MLPSRLVLSAAGLLLFVISAATCSADVSERDSTQSVRVDGSSPGRPSIGETTSGDLHELASQRTLLTLAAGGALTGLSLRLENPAEAVEVLDRVPLESVSDVGNGYGDS